MHKQILLLEKEWYATFQIESTACV